MTERIMTNVLEEEITDIGIPKIKNGSQISIGDRWITVLKVDQHFTRFQKKMLKWCFGFKVEDYSEES